MRADAASRQTFGKNSSHRFVGRMTLTGQGLILGAGTLLARLEYKTLPSEADQERIWTLLSAAYGEEISQAVLGSLRRVTRHWQGGDKCLAAIHLAQTGLPLDADRLQADLGRVVSVSPQIAQAGPVHITFAYGGASPSLD